MHRRGRVKHGLFFREKNIPYNDRVTGLKGAVMNTLGKIGSIIIVACALFAACVGLMVFGPFVLMLAVPVLLLAGCVWILKKFRQKDQC